MIPLKNNPNVNLDDLANYPDGRLIDNDGTGIGTPVNRQVYGDIHSTISKLMRLYGITPNEIPDNETNGYQIIEALKALASKNDFIYPLSTNGTILNVDIKFSKMLENEFIVCLCAFDKDTETEIKGLGAETFTITYSGDFKTNEYVRVIKTSGGVSIIRLADALSLDVMATELLYLKKASQIQEDAGLIDTVATTPLSNLTAFAKRVIGADSGNYLATAIRNGIYPKEHFSFVAGFINKVRNIGTMEGWNVEAPIVGTTFVVTGDIVSATVTVTSDNTNVIRIVLANTMTDLNYYVRTFIEGQSLDIRLDNAVGSLIFKPISATSFDITLQEFQSQAQNLKIHFEVVKI